MNTLFQEDMSQSGMTPDEIAEMERAREAHEVEELSVEGSAADIHGLESSSSSSDSSPESNRGEGDNVATE